MNQPKPDERTCGPAAFAAAPEAWVLSLNGKMIDAPHLQLARRLLAQHAPAGR